jgi:hypothetical protein
MSSSQAIFVHQRQASMLKWVALMREFLAQLIGVAFPWNVFGISQRKTKMITAAHEIQGQIQALRQLAQCMYEWTQNTHATWKTRQEGKRFCDLDSSSELLKVWNGNAWILRRPKKIRQCRQRFEKTVQDLWSTARKWHDADEKWRHSDSFKQNSVMGGFSEMPTVEEVARKLATEEYARAYDKFLIGYNEIKHYTNRLLKKEAK